MTRSKRLTPIKKLAENKAKAAAQALAECIEIDKIESQKLQQLQQYRLEYLVSMEAKIQQGVQATTLVQYHQFLSKLDLAIEQQRNVLKQNNIQLENCQNQWRDKRGKAKAIDQVMEKMAVNEEKILLKKESAQSDEMSTQAFLRRQGGWCR